MASQQPTHPRRERIQTTIRNSVDKLILSGEKITNQAVIKNAKYGDVRSVGKITLYSKYERTGEFVHANLHKFIDDATEKQRKQSGRRQSKVETHRCSEANESGVKVDKTKRCDQVVE